MRFAGTITLPQGVFSKVLEYAARSFKQHGFLDIALVGDSGGNQAGQKQVAEALNSEWVATSARVHQTGKVTLATLPRPRHCSDVERGLSLDLRVVVYTNDKNTKDFLERAALRLAPGLKRKSGARYRLNRWREDRVANGVKITCRDLVREYVRLSQTAGPFAQVPHGRYINFMSDYMAAEKSATREQAIRAWTTLKALDVPKDYRSWKKFWSSKAKQ
jgi:Creatinine amidohydrolase